MAATRTILVLSDIHYACAAERARGITEFEVIENPLLRLLVHAYRHFIWRRDPFAYNHLLDQFIARTRGADCVIANGDYSCDTAFVGLSDPPSFESAAACLGKLREAFGRSIHFTIGDHELGKTSLFGNRGGLRLASWESARALVLEPFWKLELGDHLLLGVTSTLLALPIYAPESLPGERAGWEQLRAAHLEEIRATFHRLHPRQRVLLFCHDPTALPFLGREVAVRGKLAQIEQTIIGHLHSELFLWNSRLLAGLPPIHALGNSIRRMSTALHEARHWKSFRTRLCPALGGIQLLDDGGYFRIELGVSRPEFYWHSLRRGA